MIRSPDDVGVRAPRRSLLSRGEIQSRQVQRQRELSHEEREELLDIDPTKLKFAMLNFYADHDGYDGDTPSP